MIINIFRHTKAISILIILSLCVVVWMGISFESSNTTENTSNFFYNFLISLFESKPILERFFLGTFIFWQCMLMNELMVGQKIISNNSFFPALFYFLLISISTEVIQLNSTILSMVFLILSLKKILSSYLDKNAYSKIFDSAFLISFAGLINHPFLVFIPLIWIGMSIFSQVEWRHWISSIIAIICPWFIVLTISKFFEFEKVIFNSFSFFLIENNQAYTLSLGDVLNLNLYGFLITIALIELITSLRQKNIKARKAYILLLWMIPFSIAFGLVSNHPFHIKLLLFAIPLSAIISNYFYYSKKTNWLNFLIFSLTVVMIANHLFKLY